MAITIANGFTLLENVRKDISDITDAQKISAGNYINQLFYETWYAEEPEKFITAQTISVVSGTINYSLNSSLERMDLPGCGVFETDDSGNGTEIQLPKTAYGASGEGYYLNSGNLVLTPIPQSSKTLILRYIPSLTLLSATSSSFVVPDRYSELVRDALLTWYDVHDEDSGMEGVDDSRYARTLERFRSMIRRDSSVIDASDISSCY